MFKSFKAGVSVTSILDKRHLHSDGKYAVKIRVGFKGKAWYFPVKVNLTIENWEKLPSIRNSELIKTRDLISQTFNHVEMHVNTLVKQGNFSFKNLISAIKGIKKESLNSILQQKIDECLKDGRVGNMRTYQTILSNLEKYSVVSTPIEDVTLEWLLNYEKYLLRARCQNTVMINFRGIRAAVNIALRRGIIDRNHYPFGDGGYKMKRSTSRKRALTKLQLKALINFTNYDKELMKYRDMFLFMFMCNGITVDDLIELKFSNIFEGEIYFVRRKTKNMTLEQKEIKAVITDEMASIIKRWGNKRRADTFIFPLISKTKDPVVRHTRKHTFIKTFNSHLKIIAALLAIPKFTTYTARHTYATLLQRSGVSVDFISEALGHTSLSTTQYYLEGFEKETRKKNAALLLQFIDEDEE